MVMPGCAVCVRRDMIVHARYFSGLGMQILQFGQLGKRRARRYLFALFDRQGRQRQAQPHGRIPRNQKQVVTLHRPVPGYPAILFPRQGQGQSHRFIQAPFQHPGQPCTVDIVAEVFGMQVQIGGLLLLQPQIIVSIFVAGDQETTGHFERSDQRIGKPPGLLFAIAVILVDVGQPLIIPPHRFAVATPVTGQRPPRQYLTGIPFALLILQQRVRCVVGSQAAHQLL